MRVIHNFINGEFVLGEGTNLFPNINPVNGNVISEISEAGEKEVDAAVGASREALKGPWASMRLADRADMLCGIADGISDRFNDFLEAEVADTGKPLSLASHIDIPRGAANFKVFADVIKNVPGEYFEMPTPDGGGAINYSVRSPKGSIAVICPWNLPLLLMTWKVAPALACGNTVIVKPSEETPTTATLLGEVMNKVGVPKGVYNVVHGFGPSSAGEILTQHPGVDAVTFTGETKTGETIMAAAARGVRAVSFELGGKNAGVVFADADFEAAIDGIGRAAFANCGQVCLGTERVYVQREIFDKFRDALKNYAKKLTLGAPHDKATTMGPLISKEHQNKVMSYYDQAKNDGANVIFGGGIPEMSGEMKNGSWIQPTIWTGLPENSKTIREEIFGPCTHIVPFDEEDEAINLANDTPYGLATTVWTDNLSRAHRVAREIDVGICWVNSWFLRDLRTPFGGSKTSGIGREGGIHSLEFYSELKNVCVKL